MQTSQPSDSTTTIGQLQQVINAFVKDRNWDKYHRPKNLAMSIAIEAGELMELFQWLDESAPEQSVDCNAPVAQEIADVFAYLIRLADVLGIDLTQAFLAKMERNRAKYPIEKQFMPKSIRGS